MPFMFLSTYKDRPAQKFAAWLLIPVVEDSYLAFISPAEAARKYRVTDEIVRLRRGG